MKEADNQSKCRCGNERRGKKHRECVECHREYMRGYMEKVRAGVGRRMREAEEGGNFDVEY